MQLKSTFLSLAVLLSHALVSASVQTISNPKTPPVSIKGNAFFVGDKRFYIRGIAYQPGGADSGLDAFADLKTCKRDVAKFKALGVNTVRIYAVDNTKNHNECMALLADAGIYVAVDVGTRSISLNNDYENAVHASYNDDFLQRIFATVELFSKYDNTLLFFSGNEVIAHPEKSWASPYIKAVIRDIKHYIKERGLRQIPVGYAATDLPENRMELGHYLNCGNDPLSKADFYAINDYSWCSPSSYQQSGWDTKVDAWKDYSIPLFFSEYGCKTETNVRTFAEVTALYSPKMTAVFSGGLAFEYSQENNGFGVVTINQDGSLNELEGFSLLAKALSNTPNPEGNGGYKETGGASQCPQAGQWWLPKNKSLPIIPGEASSYFQNGAGMPKGNQGAPKCSQWCGKQSSGFETPDKQTQGTAKGSKTGKNDASSWKLDNSSGLCVLILWAILSVS